MRIYCSAQVLHTGDNLVLYYRDMPKLADGLVSKTNAEMRVGANPSISTKCGYAGMADRLGSDPSAIKCMEVQILLSAQTGCSRSGLSVYDVWCYSRLLQSC